MKIERIELRLIRMELVRPFETSRHRETHRTVLLTRLLAGGLSAWGECVAGTGPWYSAETIETAWHVLRDFLAPRLLAEPFEHAGQVFLRFDAIRGHPMAKAALEMPVWVLHAQARGQSLSQALEGTQPRIESGISLGIEPSLDDLLRVVDESIAARYRRVKLKIKPGWDVKVVRAVRERHPKLRLTVDANGAYVPISFYDVQEFDRIHQLDEFGLLYIEQPYPPDCLLPHAQLQKRMKTPICLDESISSGSVADDALTLGACRVINIKPGRVGGFAHSVGINAAAEGRGVPVWCGGMLETGIGRACNVALASLPNFRLPHDISASARYWARDIVEPEFTLDADGMIAVPTAPGLGVAVDEERIEAMTERREMIEK